ncbi:MAG: hypothetical protein CV087_15995 [Candidatus Brocadia sp. WS118]|nr:MAG: hypothetical protein CV087_15995 [Candidatus Brocadia sp. WS118]
MNIPEKNEILRIFRSGNKAEMQAFVRKAPYFRLQEQTLMLVGLNIVEAPVMALNSMAAAYSQGIGEGLVYGMVTSQACYELAKETCEREDISEISRQTILSNVGTSAASYTNCLLQLGGDSYDALHKFADEAIAWLSTKGDKESCASLLLKRMEAYLNQQDYDQAEEVYKELNRTFVHNLNIADKIAYQNAEFKLKEQKAGPGRMPQTDKDTLDKRFDALSESIKAMGGFLGNDEKWIVEALQKRLEDEKDRPIDLDNLDYMMERLERFMKGENIDVQKEIEEYNKRKKEKYDK